MQQPTLAADDGRREAPARNYLLAGAAGIFFISGMPALVYQLVWQRILALHSGVGVYSVAMIVGAFMAGLGIGSAVGGLISARISRARALLGFAAVEFAIALFSAASIWLYYDVLYLRGAWIYATSWGAATAHFLALLPPTTLMGMSLPLLVRAVVSNVSGAPRVIGMLYGVNGLGAAFGAALTPWILVRTLGISGAVYVGVALNALAALGAIALGRLGDLAEQSGTRPAQSPGSDMALAADEKLPLGVWAALYALSGFCALGLEIVWFRLIDASVKSTAFTFGTVLGIYLMGLSLGSLFGARVMERIRRPLECFLGCQASLALYTAALIAFIAYVLPHVSGLRWFVDYWALEEPFVPDTFGTDPAGWSNFVRLYVVLPLLVLGTPTFLMGLSFTALQRAVQDDEQTSGRKVGLLQSANIAGSVAGSLVVGLVTLEWWGTTGTLRLLTMFGVGFAVLGCFKASNLRPAFYVMAVLLITATWRMPNQHALWVTLHGIPPSAPSYFDEDASALVALRHDPVRSCWAVFVNGKSHSHFPFKSTPNAMHVFLGAIPSLVHPAPEQIAIIGLGSGTTPWAASCRSETKKVTVFEICAAESRLLKRISDDHELPDVESFLADDRIELKIMDGRNGVISGSERYDIIECDAIRPSTAYSAHLYSKEFFTQCAAKLKSNGLMCTWAPTWRTYATFCEVFPHVLAISDDFVLGSLQPIRMDGNAWFRRLHSTHVAEYLGKRNVLLIAHYLHRVHVACPELVQGARLNSDLFPRNELFHDDPHGEVFHLAKLIQDPTRVDESLKEAWRARMRQLQPELPLTQWIESASLARAGRPEEAGRLLDEILTRAPDCAVAAYDRAIIAANQRDADAEKHLQRAAELMPCNAEILRLLAHRAQERGNRSRAARYYRQAMPFESFGESAHELAKMYLETGPLQDIPEALRLARTASEQTNGDQLEIEETLAEALLAAKDKTQAVTVLERLLAKVKPLRNQAATDRVQRQLDRVQNQASE